jgi:hypothetical protein
MLDHYKARIGVPPEHTYTVIVDLKGLWNEFGGRKFDVVVVSPLVLHFVGRLTDFPS